MEGGFCMSPVMPIHALRSLFLDGALSGIAQSYGMVVVFGVPDCPVGVILTDKDDCDLIPCLWQVGIVVYESHTWDGSRWDSVSF
jgi:hypothetical protein